MAKAHNPERNPIEQALTDLLEGPFDKVSITMPSSLKARVAARSTGSNFSSYVTEVLAREERRLALAEFLDHMDDLYGAPTPEEMADTDRRLEEMWARLDASR
ncbi:MAG: hypothetical protein ACKOBJ_03355 [Actinomycetota bacterium]